MVGVTRASSGTRAAPLAACERVFPLPAVMVSIVALTYYHTRPRRPGEASAYSVFNNHQNLPGQLTARDIDRALGHRPLADD